MAVDGIPIVYIDLGCPYVQVHQARLLLELEYPGVDLTKDAPEISIDIHVGDKMERAHLFA